MLANNLCEGYRLWHMCGAMFGCSTVCPKCQHKFACCTLGGSRALQNLSGGGLINPPPPINFGCTSSPQVSPSVPLAFVLPPLEPYAPVLHVEAEPTPDLEVLRLTETVKALRLCGWYHEGITYQQSGELLQAHAPGTFLVRDSSNPSFLFSLSVQTERGPTSARIHYANGLFRLDAQPHLKPYMPLFPGVVELIEHYVRTHGRAQAHDAHKWVDPKGKCYSSILLERPLRRGTSPPTLKHLARLGVHGVLNTPANQNRPAKLRPSFLSPAHRLPTSLNAYLAEYPYSI